MITFADKNDKTQLEKMWQSIFLEDTQVVKNFFEKSQNFLYLRMDVMR